MAETTNVTTLNMTLLLHRAAFADDFVLELGEPGYHTGTKELKIGDGQTGWKDLGFANQTQIEALIKAVDDKVAALDDTYATDAEVESIRSALQSAIDAKVAQSEYNTFKDATEQAITDINANFDNYVTNTAYNANNEAVTAALNDRYTKGEADGKFETITNVNAAKERIAAIEADYLKAADITHLETIANVDLVRNRVTAVEGKLENVTNVMDFVGALEAVPTDFTGYQKGDVIVITSGDDKGKEFVFDGTTFVEFGSVDAQQSAINVLQGRMDAVEAKNESQDGEIAKKLDATEFTSYKTAHAEDYNNTQIDSAIEDVVNGLATGAVATNAAAIENITKAETGLIAVAKAEAISAAAADAKSKADAALEAAKAYANSLDHEDTTYTFAPTANALEFTVTPAGKGEAQTVTLVAPVVDTGVMKVTAGTDVVVTPTSGTGEITVSHAAYQTGTIKAVEGTEEPNFVTSVDIQNGHVTGATVQTLRSALEGMTFVLNGGTTGANA